MVARLLLPDHFLRILMYATYFPPHYSGAAKQAVALAKELRKSGHHVEFITLRRKDEHEQGEYEGFKVWRIREGSGRYKELAFWFNFFSFIWKKRNDYEIIHSHGAYYYNSVVGPLGRLFGKKSLVKTSLADNDLSGVGDGMTGWLHRFFLNQVDAYVAISSDLVYEFERLKFPLKKCHYLPNGVDTERFYPLSPALKAQKKADLGFDVDKILALTIGVFDRRKNIGWLIDEWIDQAAFGDCALLLAIGPQSREDTGGLFFQELQEKAAQYPQYVKMMEYVDNIESYFQAADFFVLPSTNEGMPNVVLEAMASGLPTLATRISGCEDLIEDGIHGFLFMPNDGRELSNVLKQLVHSDLHRLGCNAREKVVEKYSLSRLVERYENLYMKILNKSLPD